MVGDHVLRAGEADNSIHDDQLAVISKIGSVPRPRKAGCSGNIGR
jgi:hypothetical protein